METQKPVYWLKEFIFVKNYLNSFDKCNSCQKVYFNHFKKLLKKEKKVKNVLNKLALNLFLAYKLIFSLPQKKF